MEISTLKIIIATNNNHKFSEMKAILKSHLNLKDNVFFMPKDLNLNFDAIENKQTFEENAKIKSQYIYNELKKHKINSQNVLIISDDSGLCVDALDKMPGIFSARFANIAKNDNENIQNLQNCSDEENREALKNAIKKKNLYGSKAQFVCAISCILQVQNKHGDKKLGVNQSKILYKKLDYIGTLNGIISINEVQGNGFGYDSMFYVDKIDNIDFSNLKDLEKLKMPLSKLSSQEKNHISHRSRALEKLILDLKQRKII